MLYGVYHITNKNLHLLTITSKQQHHVHAELRKSKEWIVAALQLMPLPTISVAVKEMNTSLPGKAETTSTGN